MYSEDSVPPPPPRMGGKGPVIIAIALVVASVLAIGFTFYLARGGRDDTPPAARPSYKASPVPSSARFAQVGECVQNKGTDAKPEMVQTPCTPGALEVLARMDGTTDVKQCLTVPGYRYHYFYDSELAGLDFVLCMREHP